jgi:hypothetical protein
MHLYFTIESELTMSFDMDYNGHKPTWPNKDQDNEPIGMVSSENM